MKKARLMAGLFNSLAGSPAPDLLGFQLGLGPGGFTALDTFMVLGQPVPLGLQVLIGFLDVRRGRVGSAKRAFTCPVAVEGCFGNHGPSHPDQH